MSEEENLAHHEAALHAQLTLFCQLMLGSAEAADRMVHQIYHRALDHRDKREKCSSKRVHLFGIAAELCGVLRNSRSGHCLSPGDDGNNEECCASSRPTMR
ncbi:hypothetical protein DFR70_103463 [Nocardia tenerifensis]|uniref:Uncharacterized protein n=1 Tax=Nocardia tenerifensis TaxID=228006 RepID=A0A318KHU1_9NOCA|nr:hypothetical protein [Nocardia tenerifensis]PXX66713.1 hypothetical protein DFR70_103463 [Nocardia tenerifensis]